MSDVVEQVDAEVSMADQAVAELGGDSGESSFFDYGDGDNKLTFKTPDELKAHLDKSINFERDYTKKSQARESEYRQRQAEIEKMKADFQKEREEWEKSTKSKYDKYEEVLKTRPAVAKQLAQLAERPVSPDEIYERSTGYVDEKSSALEERLKALESRLEEERLEKERDGIYSELEKNYPDIRDVTSKTLSDLDGNDMRSLIEMVYKASKYDPTAIREQVEQDIARKGQAKMVPSGSGPPATKKGSTDIKGAHKEALEWAGVET